MKYRRYSTFLFLILICNFSFGQSRKKIIENLNQKLDSIQHVLKEIQNLYDINLAEIKRERGEMLKLKFKSDSLQKKLESENLGLKAKLDALTLKYDSLLKNTNEIPYTLSKTGNLNSHTIFDYFNRETNDNIPGPYQETNYSQDVVLPVAWNKDGCFAYYIVPHDVCGFCGADYVVEDLNNRREVLRIKYDFQSGIVHQDAFEEQQMLNQIISDRLHSYNTFDLTDISKLDWIFFDSKDDYLIIENNKIFIEITNKKGALYLLDNLGRKRKLFEKKLTSFYHYGFFYDCDESLKINGWFLNPLNKNQVILHIFDIKPCGFENENMFSNIFISFKL
ncbi:MAG: hypothetical protein ACK5CY_08425 [Bacteroidia bacterium]|jgi:hypothetical protein